MQPSYKIKVCSQCNGTGKDIKPNGPRQPTSPHFGGVWNATPCTKCGGVGYWKEQEMKNDRR